MSVAPADRFTAYDLLIEASHGVGARPSRLVMTALGTVLGIASLVVTIGLAQTGAAQIARQFDSIAATQVVIELAGGQDDESDGGTDGFPIDAAQRVERLAGVRAAALVGIVALPNTAVSAVSVLDPSQPPEPGPLVAASSPGLLAASGGEVLTGRFFDEGHEDRADRVAVLGEEAAARLGVARVDTQPAVFVEGVPLTVIGIIGGLERRDDLADAVIVPLNTASELFGLTGAQQLLLRIDVGAGDLVGRQAPTALDPNSPSRFSVAAPPATTAFREGIQGDVNGVLLVLGIIALLAGGAGIVNVTMLSVAERRGEIGLRRALGARTRDITRQFIAESTIIGMVGGLVGASLGVLAVIGTSLAQQWSPQLDPLVALGSVFVGAVVGLAAGAYPAFRASRIEPIEALRGGT